MFIDLESVSIFIRPGATDMRKQVNGLSVIVDEQMAQNPGSGSLYLFCSRNRRLIKCLWWDRNGFCLCQKRVESGRFPWPGSREEVHQISREELMMMLAGIDFWSAHQEIEYEYV